MKTNFKLFDSLLIVTLFLCLISINAKSQCPAQFDPYPNIPWTNQGCVIMMVSYNGTWCETNVCYCWRNVGISAPFIEIYVNSHVLTNPNCTNMPWQERCTWAGIQLIKSNPNNSNWPCPPCPSDLPNYNIYVGACLDTYGLPCSNGRTYCKQTYIVCCDPQTGVRSANSVGNPIIIGDY